MLYIEVETRFDHRITKDNSSKFPSIYEKVQRLPYSMIDLHIRKAGPRTSTVKWRKFVVRLRTTAQRSLLLYWSHWRGNWWHGLTNECSHTCIIWLLSLQTSHAPYLQCHWSEADSWANAKSFWQILLKRSHSSNCLIVWSNECNCL